MSNRKFKNKGKRRKLNMNEKIINNEKKVALLDYIPTDLLFSFTSLKFDKKHFNMLKLCSKQIYEKFKNDSWEKWETIDHSASDIKKLIENGYRNFRVNDIEFFVVNAKIKFINYFGYKYAYSLYTSSGKIIGMHCDYVSITGSRYIPSSKIKNIQYLKESYPFSAQSRPITVYNN